MIILANKFYKELYSTDTQTNLDDKQTIKWTNEVKKKTVNDPGKQTVTSKTNRQTDRFY